MGANTTVNAQSVCELLGFNLMLPPCEPEGGLGWVSGPVIDQVNVVLFNKVFVVCVQDLGTKGL